MPLHQVLWNSRESAFQESPSNFIINLPETITQDSNEQSSCVELTNIVLTGIQNVWEEVLKLSINTSDEPTIHTLTIPQGNYSNSSLRCVVIREWGVEKRLFTFDRVGGKLKWTYSGSTPATLSMSSALAIKFGLMVYSRSHSDVFTFNFIDQNTSMTSVNKMNVNALMERGNVILNKCSLMPKTLIARKDENSHSVHLIPQSVLATFKLPYNEEREETEGKEMPRQVCLSIITNQTMSASFAMGHHGFQCQITDELLRPFPFHPQGNVEISLTLKT